MQCVDKRIHVKRPKAIYIPSTSQYIAINGRVALTVSGEWGAFHLQDVSPQRSNKRPFWEILDLGRLDVLPNFVKIFGETPDK